MESVINYYYGINPVCITLIKDYYIIKTKNDIYIFSELFESIEDLKKMIDILNQTDLKYHLLVLTKNNESFIQYDGGNFVLLKVRCDLNEKINLYSFVKYPVMGKCNWGDVWAKRIDYYETQLNEVVKDNTIKYSIQYYIGITEIAIAHFNKLKSFNNDSLTYTISHKKLISPIDVFEFYNPLNMFVDLEVRDIAEYVKFAFFNETLTDYEILSLVDNLKMTDIMANYFYVRLLYPSYFFNLYDEYIDTREINDSLIFIIKKSKEFESLLSKIFSRLTISNNLYVNLWFIKSQHL